MCIGGGDTPPPVASRRRHLPVEYTERDRWGTITLIAVTCVRDNVLGKLKLRCLIDRGWVVG